MKIYCARRSSIDSIVDKDIWVYLRQHKAWCKVIDIDNANYICDIFRGREDMMDFMESMPLEYRLKMKSDELVRALPISEYKDDFEQALSSSTYLTTDELFGLSAEDVK